MSCGQSGPCCQMANPSALEQALSACNSMDCLVAAFLQRDPAWLQDLRVVKGEDAYAKALGMEIHELLLCDSVCIAAIIF